MSVRRRLAALAGIGATLVVLVGVLWWAAGHHRLGAPTGRSEGVAAPSTIGDRSSPAPTAMAPEGTTGAAPGQSATGPATGALGSTAGAAASAEATMVSAVSAGAGRTAAGAAITPLPISTQGGSSFGNVPNLVAPSDPAVPTPDAVVAELRAEPPARDLTQLAPRMGRSSAAGPTSEPPRQLAVGDQEAFWVHDIEDQRYLAVNATLAVVTDQAYFWVQDGLSYDPAGLEEGARKFSEEVIPAVRKLIGTEWSPGIDGDVRLHVLHHEDIPGVAGFFSSSDEYPTSVEPNSNQHEMFYINMSAFPPGSYDYLALLAHEFQHMIHWWQDIDETTWVGEGLSELAPVVAGYPVQTGAAYLRQPDTPLLEWEPEAGANAAHYAGAFLLMAYLRAQYGDEAIRALVRSPGNGANGIEQALGSLGEPASFDDLYADWVVANLVDDVSWQGGRFSYGDLAIDRVRPAPLADAGTGMTVQPYGTDYYDVTGAAAGGQLTLRFQGDPAIGLLEPVDEDNPVWWSARGDSDDSRLTRALDLRGALSAELDFRVWYDLETNWDYGYVTASPDEGRTWQHLEAAHTTDYDPNGNNFGSGFTGASSGWMDESVDLTSFAGSPVLVRFEVVTDDAVDLTGMALDDIRLRTVSAASTSGGSQTVFEDDASADRGWRAEGWQRLSPRLAQRWLLQAIVDTSGGRQLRRFPVAPDGTASVSLADLPPDAHITLAISAITPGTRNAATYTLTPSAS